MNKEQSLNKNFITIGLSVFLAAFLYLNNFKNLFYVVTVFLAFLLSKHAFDS